MKKFIVFAILIISSVIFGCSFGGNEISLPQPDYIMTTREFRDNVWAINSYDAVGKKYNGKIVRITGKYHKIETANGAYFMTMAYYPRPYDLGIYVAFSMDKRSKLSQLIRGEDIVIQGTAKWHVQPPYCTLVLVNANVIKP